METVIANPPFSAKWSADVSFMDDERFSEVGKLAPKSKADYAFVLDIVHKAGCNRDCGYSSSSWSFISWCCRRCYSQVSY